MSMAPGVRKGPKKAWMGVWKKVFMYFDPAWWDWLSRRRWARHSLGHSTAQTRSLPARWLMLTFIWRAGWRIRERPKIPNNTSSHKIGHWQTKWKVKSKSATWWKLRVGSWSKIEKLRDVIALSIAYVLSLSIVYVKVCMFWHRQNIIISKSYRGMRISTFPTWCMCRVCVFVLENDRSLEGGWVGNGRHCKI